MANDGGPAPARTLARRRLPLRERELRAVERTCVLVPLNDERRKRGRI
jgi:hypothetical protein